MTTYTHNHVRLRARLQSRQTLIQGEALANGRHIKQITLVIDGVTIRWQVRLDALTQFTILRNLATISSRFIIVRILEQ